MRMHARVWGRVQGVYYRASTQREAERLGLCGWVRNRADGTVELVAEGPERALEALLSWVHRGPETADVTRVEVVWEDPVALIGFEVRPTL
ncbi:MAG: acylphosphatase [Myxococcota bacterium]|nr:acylphosphatase [Myxococcota bacterium]MEC8423806.1 acylphosphatase [Myxococcota bacterium]